MIIGYTPSLTRDTRNSSTKYQHNSIDKSITDNDRYRLNKKKFDRVEL